MLKSIITSISTFFLEYRIARMYVEQNLNSLFKLDDAAREQIIRKMSLDARFGPVYDKRAISKVYDENSANSYFHKEYDTKTYKKFQRIYEDATLAMISMERAVYKSLKGQCPEVSISAFNGPDNTITVQFDTKELCRTLLANKNLYANDDEIRQEFVKFYAHYQPQLSAIIRRKHGFE